MKEQSKTEEKTENLPAKANLVPDSLKGFSDDQISGGMGSSVGYLESFSSKMMVIDTDEFKIREGDDLSEGFKTLDCQILYAHQVYRLRQGHIDGVQGAFNTWSEDQKKVVAQSFAAPFAQGNVIKSRGNLDPQYSDWLDVQEKRQQLEKRYYMFLVAPSIDASEIIPCSFGIMTFKGLDAYKALMQKEKISMSSIITKMFLTKEKTQNGSNYYRANFEMSLDKNGQARPLYKSMEHFNSDGWPLVVSVAKKHADQVKNIETTQTKTVSAGPEIVGGMGGFDESPIPWE